MYVQLYDNVAFEVWGPRPLWALAGWGEGVPLHLNPIPRAAYGRQGEGLPVQHFRQTTLLIGVVSDLEGRFTGL